MNEHSFDHADDMFFLKRIASALGEIETAAGAGIVLDVLEGDGDLLAAAAMPGLKADPEGDD